MQKDLHFQYIDIVSVSIQMYVKASFMNIYEYKCKQRSCSSKKKCFSRQSQMRAGSGNQVHQPKLRFLFLSSQSSPSIWSPSSCSANRGTVPFHSLPLSSSSMLFCDALWSFALLHLQQERSALFSPLEIVIFSPAGRSPSRAVLMMLTLPHTYRGNLWPWCLAGNFFEMCFRYFTTGKCKHFAKKKCSTFKNPDGRQKSKIKIHCKLKFIVHNHNPDGPMASYLIDYVAIGPKAQSYLH